MIRHDLPFRHPSTKPAENGLYVRDWRGTKVEPKRARCLSVDRFETDGDFSCWYVLEGGINDATEQALPWRELAGAEHRLAIVRQWIMALR